MAALTQVARVCRLRQLRRRSQSAVKSCCSDESSSGSHWTSSSKGSTLLMPRSPTEVCSPSTACTHTWRNTQKRQQQLRKLAGHYSTRPTNIKKADMPTGGGRQSFSHHVHQLFEKVPWRLAEWDEHFIQVIVTNPLLEHLLQGWQKHINENTITWHLSTDNNLASVLIKQWLKCTTQGNFNENCACDEFPLQSFSSDWGIQATFVNFSNHSFPLYLNNSIIMLERVLWFMSGSNPISLGHGSFDWMNFDLRQVWLWSKFWISISETKSFPSATWGKSFRPYYYCNSLYSAYSKKKKKAANRLQLVQNAAAWLLKRTTGTH